MGRGLGLRASGARDRYPVRGCGVGDEARPTLRRLSSHSAALYRRYQPAEIRRYVQTCFVMSTSQRMLGVEVTEQSRVVYQLESGAEFVFWFNESPHTR